MVNHKLYIKFILLLSLPIEFIHIITSQFERVTMFILYMETLKWLALQSQDGLRDWNLLSAKRKEFGGIPVVPWAVVAMIALWWQWWPKRVPQNLLCRA